jgi:exopolysaccharide biosynthesis protein
MRLGVALCLLLPLVASAARWSVAYEKLYLRHSRVHAVLVDLHDPALWVTPVVAYGAAGNKQTFTSFNRDYNPLAQVTGSYFSTSSGFPIGDVVARGEMRYDGQVGSALCVTAENKADIVDADRGVPLRWRGYESVLQGGVRLVTNGKKTVYPADQGFRDRALYRPATRTAVGLRNGKLLMVAATKPMYLSDLARILLDMGVEQGMTMDGGTSTGIAHDGRVLVRPGRALSNVLMVMPRPGMAAGLPLEEAPAIAQRVIVRPNPTE